ncbi:hypothetical protein G6011_07921 [Alternaria panax]|uniref:Uncharacterized protein n=1 Tax=Alternaria panax TaxID=48097 RepID=A0AAD4F8C8_9PLEO|nr:hypothetical protein G6011_07921 [Alternaria panax]
MAPKSRVLTSAYVIENMGNITIVPPVKAPENGQCFFLELPGDLEIQNRVYSYAREDGHVRFQPRKSRKSRIAPVKAQGEGSNWTPAEIIQQLIFLHSSERYVGGPSEVGDFPFATTEDDDARRLKKSLRQFHGLT